MIKFLGRLAARKGVATIFVPSKDFDFDGVYELREVMGELQLRYVGQPAMRETEYYGKDCNGLFDNRTTSLMTKEEWAEINGSAE